MKDSKKSANNDWLIRLKGKHAITVSSNGVVIYSIGKTKLFILNSQALSELKDMIQSSLDMVEDGIAGNEVRYKVGNKPVTIHNSLLYTRLWKFIYDQDHIKCPKDNYREIADAINDYVASQIKCSTGEIDDSIFDVFYQVFTDAQDPVLLSLLDLISTKTSKIYYDFVPSAG